MYYTTPVQPKIGTDKIIQRYTHSTLFTLSENDFRCLHLDDWKSLRRYHRTLHPHNLTFTISIKFDFKILHQRNLKSLSTIWLHAALAQPGFQDTCTTWFQGSPLGKKWHFHDTLAHPNFHSIRKTWYPWLFHSYCVDVFCMYIFRT